MLAGGQRVAARDVPTHTDCSLGRWYAGRARREWGSLPEYQAVLAPHQRFHEVLARLVRLAEAGNTRAAENNLAELKQASRAVLQALDSLEQRIDHRGADPELAPAEQRLMLAA